MASGRRVVPGLFAVSILLACGGCNLKDRFRSFFQDDSRSAVAVRVGDRTYTKASLDHYFDTRLSEFRDPAGADRIKSNLLESFVEDKLLLQEAENHHVQANQQILKSMMDNMTAGDDVHSGPPEQEKQAELKRDLTESLETQQFLHDYLLKDISISDAQIEEYYMAHIGDFVRNDLAHVREILVEDPAQARKVLESLAAKKNKNFGELARVYSVAPSASDGGDLGTFQRGDLPEEFEKVIFPLAPGTVSKIVRTKYGYHIFMVEEKIAAHQQKLWEVKDQIRERLQQEKERDLIDKEVAGLAARIPVRIYKDKLDFRYIGSRFRTN